jgi:hypothetical protein
MSAEVETPTAVEVDPHGLRKAGEPVLPKRELAEALDVSRVTISQTLDAWWPCIRYIDCRPIGGEKLYAVFDVWVCAVHQLGHRERRRRHALAVERERQEVAAKAKAPKPTAPAPKPVATHRKWRPPTPEVIVIRRTTSA